MNKDAFTELLMRPLAMWSNSGDMTNDVGTRLIGHTPHVAPKAYTHVVYAPLHQAEFIDLVARLGRPLPPQFEQFLTHANGLSIFQDRLRVFGYVPLPSTRKASTHVHNFSTDVVVPNVSARIRGMSQSALAVGRYRLDGSYVAIESDGTAVRFDPKGNAGAVRTWPDFDTWIISEIAALSRSAISEARKQ